jgi:hypothetical protein
MASGQHCAVARGKVSGGCMVKLCAVASVGVNDGRCAVARGRAIGGCAVIQSSGECAVISVGVNDGAAQWQGVEQVVGLQ